MDQCNISNRILLLLLLLIINVIHAMVTDSIFNMVDDGQSVIGKIEAELLVKTNIQCSMMLVVPVALSWYSIRWTISCRCLNTHQCTSYKYTGTRQRNCLLITRNSTAAKGEIFELDANNVFYGKYPSLTWTSPSAWTGHKAALYRSFDNTMGLIFMETAKEIIYAPLVAGQVHYAWNLNRTRSQWVDLGIHTNACMTRPETCGAAGGAISLWVNLEDCPDWAGVLSSREFGKTTSHIYCRLSLLRFRLSLPDGFIQADLSPPSGWTHLILNYLSSLSGDDRINIYYNGVEVGSNSDKIGEPFSTGNGRIVVGTRFTERDQDYASMQADELIFFNRALSKEEVESMYESI